VIIPLNSHLPQFLRGIAAQFVFDVFLVGGNKRL
jgi:hypothetical protein